MICLLFKNSRCIFDQVAHYCPVTCLHVDTKAWAQRTVTQDLGDLGQVLHRVLIQDVLRD